MSNELTKFATELAKTNINLELKVKKNTFYVGEAFIADYYLIVNDNIVLQDIKAVKEPKFHTFTSKEINFGELKFTDTLIDNLHFKKALLHRYLLQGKASGKTNLDELGLDLSARIPLENNSEYLAQYPDGYVDIQFTSTSNSTPIEIIQLPKNKFNEKCVFIGDFDISTEASAVTVNKNEHVLMKVNILGNGYLSVPYVPTVERTTGLKINIYNTLDSFVVENNSIYSWKNYELDLFSSDTGSYIIKPIEILCFSPTTKEYYTLASEAIPVFFLDDTHKEVVEDSSSQQILIYFLVFGFLILIGLIVFFYKKNISKKKVNNKENTSEDDFVYTSLDGDDVIKNYLSAAAMAINDADTDKFLKLLLTAIDKFIEDKFQIEKQNLSDEEIYNLLTEKGVSEVMAQNYLIVQSKIEEMRFSSKQTSIDKEELLIFIEQFLLRL